MPTDEISSSDTLSLTSEIVASFVNNNSLPVAEPPNLIQSVHAALTAVASGMVAAAEPEASARTPAVSARRSIHPDYLICLDDGRKFKSMKRHVAGLGMTPQQYRAKWNLPKDYPMVAPNYAAARSALAKKSGLGQTRKNGGALKIDSAGKGKRGRPRKVSV